MSIFDWQVLESVTKALNPKISQWDLFLEYECAYICSYMFRQETGLLIHFDQVSTIIWNYSQHLRFFWEILQSKDYSTVDYPLEYSNYFLSVENKALAKPYNIRLHQNFSEMPSKQFQITFKYFPLSLALVPHNFNDWNDLDGFENTSWLEWDGSNIKIHFIGS